ncbi:MAG: CBS domain-containing protein [Thermoleophilaceae bacterium]|nr:CBS domain-containing protein [Thermoleophilaceae bacterium]
MTPSGTSLDPLHHTFQAPEFDKATVLDAMRLGVISCSGDTPLREAARMMSTYRIHCVVVFDLEGERPWGVVSDLDLAAAAGTDPDEPVRAIASTELVTVTAGEPLARAAQLLAEHQVSHLVVVKAEDGHPIGVLSTLDVAGVLAWGGSA